MNAHNGNHGDPPSVLLVGYNGANNAGAEALLLSDIADVRAVLGDDALITVPTLNEANLRRYVKEGPNLRIAPIPTIFPLALRDLGQIRNDGSPASHVSDAERSAAGRPPEMPCAAIRGLGGSLVIVGRKKELIKTSYGKYAHPAEVESRLKEIPCVAEAMLVGEGRPFCVALMWIGDQSRAPLCAESMDRAVMAVNAGLAHPEQVKRWALLPNDLSIEGGDLTPNLKLKRQAVARRFQGVLDALYNGCAVTAPVLHIGAADRVGA